MNRFRTDLKRAEPNSRSHHPRQMIDRGTAGYVDERTKVNRAPMDQADPANARWQMYAARNARGMADESR